MSERYIILGLVAVGLGTFVVIKARQVNIPFFSGGAAAADTSGAGTTPGTGSSDVDTTTNSPDGGQ
jgi:hypothetical protein